MDSVKKGALKQKNEWLLKILKYIKNLIKKADWYKANKNIKWRYKKFWLMNKYWSTNYLKFGDFKESAFCIEIFIKSFWKVSLGKLNGLELKIIMIDFRYIFENLNLINSKFKMNFGSLFK